MEVLKLAICALLVAGGTAWAGSEDQPDEHDLAVAAQAGFLCHSTDEYVKTLKFLRANKSLVFPETTSRLIAEKVSRGCDGAAERFSQILLLLKSIGLSDHKTLEMALEFSAQPPDVQKNFNEIFTKAFLAEFFDYEYHLAAKLAFELSRDYKGDPVQARKDFIELVRYCKDGKTLDLPAKLCADLTVRLVRLSQYFPAGIRKPFYKLYSDLRSNREFGLDMKSALDISYNVLRSGPNAPTNFYSAYSYGTSKEGLNLDQHQALEFALKMADRSFIGGEHPPPIAGPSDGRGPASAAKP